jgi:hypothetical protein
VPRCAEADYLTAVVVSTGEKVRVVPWMDSVTGNFFFRSRSGKGAKYAPSRLESFEPLQWGTAPLSKAVMAELRKVGLNPSRKAGSGSRRRRGKVMPAAAAAAAAGLSQPPDSPPLQAQAVKRSRLA